MRSKQCVLSHYVFFLSHTIRSSINDASFIRVVMQLPMEISCSTQLFTITARTDCCISSFPESHYLFSHTNNPINVFFITMVIQTGCQIPLSSQRTSNDLFRNCMKYMDTFSLPTITSTLVEFLPNIFLFRTF